MDFELAALDAMREVFPESRLKDCMFHYRQAILRHVQSLHLRESYSSSSGIAVVRNWIREIMGLSLLPEQLISFAWNTLQNPLNVEDAFMQINLKKFSEYFENTWMIGLFPPHLWCHHSNMGPRTTNLAEGWHNSLNHSFGISHPSAANFLHWLQLCEYETNRIRVESFS